MVTATLLQPDLIRRALRDWHTVQLLGAHPLVDLESVRAHQRKKGYSATTAGRGLALQDVLRAALEQLRPGGDPPQYGERRWRPYLILTEQFLQERAPDVIADRLGISRRTYYSDQEQALGMLLSVLVRWEDECQQAQREPPRPAPAAVFLAPPRPVHPLIGREALLEELVQQLVSGSKRRIALQGLPGVGKTALAIELAHHPAILEHFCDGVLWAGLGQTPDIFALQGSWAMRLGVSDIAQYRSSAQRASLLYAGIGMRKMLLVIDDAWSVEHAQAFVVGGPFCAYVLTTRIPLVGLDVAGEGLWAIPELPSEQGLALLGQFVPQLVAAQPQEAAMLVRATGGLPLGLILIGHHLRQHGHGLQQRRLRETLAELQQAETRLRIARPQSPMEAHTTLPPESAISLQAVIGISDAALNQVERRALRALALFPPKPNTFDEAAALATIDAPAQVLDALVDAGILEGSGVDRYTLHQTIADYLRSDPPGPEALRRMAGHLFEMIGRPVADYRLLDQERDNLLEALRLCADHQEQALCVAGALAAMPFMILRGLYQQALEVLQRALEWVPESETQCRCDLLLYRDEINTVLGRHDQLGSDLERLATLAAQLDSDRLRLEVLLRQASHRYWLGRYADMADLARQAVTLAQRTGSQEGEIKGRLWLGRALWPQMAYPEACAQFEQALHMAQASNLPGLAADAQRAWGVAANQYTDYERAHLCHEQSLNLYRKLGNRRGEAFALNNLAIVAVNQEKYAQAQSYFEHALEINAELGEQRNMASVQLNLGQLLGMGGQLDQAQRYLEQGYRLTQELQLPDLQGYALRSQALLSLQLGDLPRARRLLAEAIACHDQSGNQLNGQRYRAEMAEVLRREAAYGEALALVEQALPQLEQHGDRQSAADAWLVLGKIVARLGQRRRAAQAYASAIALYQEIKFNGLVAQAGLAALALQEEQLDQARAHARAMLERIAQPFALAFMFDPFEIYLACYEVLARCGDAQAEEVLGAGRSALARWAATVSDPERRRSFLAATPARRALGALP